MTKNSERFQPFKLDFSTFVGFLKKRTFTFRGWNGILEFESRRNKSSTYFSFRTGKYFASQEAPFLLSRIKKPFMISIQMQEMDSKRSFSQANTNTDLRTVCNKKVGDSTRHKVFELQDYIYLNWHQESTAVMSTCRIIPFSWDFLVFRSINLRNS